MFSRRLRVGTALLAALAGGLSACSSSTSAAPTSTGFTGNGRDFASLRVLMRDRSADVLSGNESAFLATVDPTNPQLLASQRVLFRNLRQLPIAKLTYYVADFSLETFNGVPGPDPRLRPPVREHLQLRGTDAKPISNPVEDTFVRRSGRWYLADERMGGPGDMADAPVWRPWYGGPIAVAHDGPLVVIVDGSGRSLLQRLLRHVHADILFDAATLHIRPDFNVAVDATTHGMTSAMNAASPEKASAVTEPIPATNADGSAFAGTAGMLIKINPRQVRSLIGDPELLRHELTHFLLHRYNDYAPVWLVEGVAEYVATHKIPMRYLDYGPRDLRFVRRASRSHTLPTSQAFYLDDANYAIGQAAVRWLVDTYGTGRLLRMFTLFRRAGGTNNDSAEPGILHEVYGITPRELADHAYALALSGAS